MASDKNKQPFYLIDTNSQFYRPALRRYAICASVTVWAGLEIYGRQPFWAVIAAALAVYCFYTLVIAYRPPADPASIPTPPVADDDVADDVSGDADDRDLRP